MIMDKNELWRLIQKTEKLFERRKAKRMVLTILLYVAVCFLAICVLDNSNIKNFSDIIDVLVASIFIGGIAFFFNLLVWSYLCQKSQDEKDALEYLNSMLKAKEREENQNRNKLNK